jgi:hypothetical protein
MAIAAAVVGGIIAAAAGNIAGIIGTGQAAERQKAQHRLQQEQLKHQKETAWQKYLLNREYADTEWNLSRSEALSGLALQENRLGEAVDLNMGQYNTALEGQALGLQDAQIQSAGSIGALLAGESAAGVRGASSSGLIRSYGEASLQRQAALQGRESRDSLYAMLSGADNARDDIGIERASWNEGGYRALRKEESDAYNLAAAKAEQSNYDWGIENAADYYNASKVNGWDYFAGFLSGGNTGWSIGSSIGNSIGNYGDGSAGSGAESGNSFDGVGGSRNYVNEYNDLVRGKITLR